MTGRLIDYCNAALDFIFKCALFPLCRSRLETSELHARNALTFLFILMFVFAQDNVFVMVAAVVQYRCGKDKVEDAFYTLYNPHQQIEAYVNDGKLLRLESI